jgi:hypothetical protein
MENIVINTLTEKLNNLNEEITTTKENLSLGFTKYLQSSEIGKIVNEFYTRFEISGEYNPSYNDNNIQIEFGEHRMIYTYKSYLQQFEFNNYSSSTFKVDMNKELQANKESLFQYYSLRSEVSMIESMLNENIDIINEYDNHLTQLKTQYQQVKDSIYQLELDKKTKQINEWIESGDEIKLKSQLRSDCNDDDNGNEESVYFYESDNYKMIYGKFKVEGKDKSHKENRVLNIKWVKQIDKNRYEGLFYIYGAYQNVTITKDNLYKLLSDVYDWNNEGWKGSWDDSIKHALRWNDIEGLEGVDFSTIQLNHNYKIIKEELAA